VLAAVGQLFWGGRRLHAMQERLGIDPQPQNADEQGSARRARAASSRSLLVLRGSQGIVIPAARGQQGRPRMITPSWRPPLRSDSANEPQHQNSPTNPLVAWQREDDSDTIVRIAAKSAPPARCRRMPRSAGVPSFVTACRQERTARPSRSVDCSCQGAACTLCSVSAQMRASRTRGGRQTNRATSFLKSGCTIHQRRR